MAQSPLTAGVLKDLFNGLKPRRPRLQVLQHDIDHNRGLMELHRIILSDGVFSDSSILIGHDLVMDLYHNPLPPGLVIELLQYELFQWPPTGPPTGQFKLMVGDIRILFQPGTIVGAPGFDRQGRPAAYTSAPKPMPVPNKAGPMKNDPRNFFKANKPQNDPSPMNRSGPPTGKKMTGPKQTQHDQPDGLLERVQSAHREGKREQINNSQNQGAVGQKSQNQNQDQKSQNQAPASQKSQNQAPVGQTAQMQASGGKKPNKGRRPSIEAEEFVPRWKTLKLEGKTAVEKKDYATALQLYSQAIEGIPMSERKERAILKSNRSLVYSKLDFPHEALEDALESIRLDKDYSKGYWRAASIFRQLNQKFDALECFYDGSCVVSHDDRTTKCEFLTEIVVLCYELKDWKRVKSGDIKASDQTWSLVILALSRNNKWRVMATLLYGKDGKSGGYARNLSGRIAKIDARNVELTKLLTVPQEDQIVQTLAVRLLECGASIKSITLTSEDTPLHAALELAFKTGKPILLKHLLEKYYKTNEEKNTLDKNGDSLLHVAAKQFRKTPAVKLTGILLDNGLDPCLSDKCGRLPLDHVPKGNESFQLLNKAMQTQQSKKKPKTPATESSTRKQETNNNTKPKTNTCPYPARLPSGDTLRAANEAAAKSQQSAKRNETSSGGASKESEDPNQIKVKRPDFSTPFLDQIRDEIGAFKHVIADFLEKERHLTMRLNLAGEQIVLSDHGPIETKQAIKATQNRRIDMERNVKLLNKLLSLHRTLDQRIFKVTCGSGKDSMVNNPLGEDMKELSEDWERKFHEAMSPRDSALLNELLQMNTKHEMMQSLISCIEHYVFAYQYALIEHQKQTKDGPVKLKKETASDFFQHGQNCMMIQNYALGLQKFVLCLQEVRMKDSSDVKLIEPCLTFILDKIIPELPSIPEDTKLNLSRLKCEEWMAEKLKKLSEANKWKVIVNLVLGGGNGHKKSEGGLLTDSDLSTVSLSAFMASVDYKQMPFDMRNKFIQILIKNGANPNGTEKFRPIRKALESEDYKMAAMLLDLGADPSFITLHEMDSPLHYALKVGLNKMEGNFDLLKLLLKLHSHDSEKYKFLHRNTQDNHGNTLFHMVVKPTKCTHELVEAVKLLVQYKVNPKILNSEGKDAISYLKKNDRRMPYTLNAATHYSKYVPVKFKKKKKTKLDPKTAVSESEVDDNHSKMATSESNMAESNMAGGDNHLSQQSTFSKEKHNQNSGLYIKSSKEECKRNIQDLIESLPAIILTQQPSPSKKFENRPHLDSESDSRSTTPDIEVVGQFDEVDDDGDDDEDEEDVEANEKIDDANEVDLNMLKMLDDFVWEVECTANVWKTLRDKRVNRKLKLRIINKIKQLAKGNWRPSLAKKLDGQPRNEHVQLYEAKLSKGSRIIWELAIAFSPRCSENPEKLLGVGEGNDPASSTGGRIYSEVIRVWDIVFDHNKIYHSVENICRSHNRGEDCIIRKNLQGMKRKKFKHGNTSDQRVPMYYREVTPDKSSTVSKMQQFCPPASSNETEYHILKFYAFNSPMVNSVLQNPDIKVDFPFRVTELEHAIINLDPTPPQALLLLGRSGTGKTTVCLYRLWTFFVRYWEQAAMNGYDPLIHRHIVFIHQDSAEDVELEELEEDAVENKPAGATGTLAKVCHDNHVDEADEFTAEHCLKAAAAAAAAGEEGDDYEEDNEEDQPLYEHLHQVFITKNGVLLQDAHPAQFPLFLTSKQWLLLLDASLPNPYFPRNADGSLRRAIQGWGTNDGPLAFVSIIDDSDDELDDVTKDDAEDEHLDAPVREFDPRREVTYDVFVNELWTKVNKTKESYHPTLVWTEIKSFIKGSIEALHSHSGVLSQGDYLDLGKKRAPNFTADRRVVYQMFERYQHLKHQRGLFDESDLVFNIYTRLKDMLELDWSLHQIYVDETQDFTQAELSLFIRCSQDPNALFLTGDTAQSIMRGVAFRFGDLKSLFHYAHKTFKAVGKQSAITVPKKVHQLVHNYRSHAGILNLASSVVDIMVKFFPESFDRLERDQGLFQGPKPVLLDSCSFSDLALILRGNRRKTSEIEFGAHQVILVANEAAKAEIPDELSVGLVLTIFESKGLEFDDVLLYNFFKDSPACKEWRVVTSYLEELIEEHRNSRALDKETLIELDIDDVKGNSNRPRPLQFDPDKHKVLNSELKFLYTALTRARVNIWIFDEDLDTRAPMFEYFTRRKLVEKVTVKDDESEEGLNEAIFAHTSTQEEWLKRGDYYMSHKLYEVAAKCYRKGNSSEKEMLAMAHHKAIQAEQLRNNPKKMREEFLLAAESFLKCELALEAAKCLYNAKEFLMGARLFEKLQKYNNAAVLYQKAKCPGEASMCYEMMHDYKRAIESFVSQELYDKAADVVERYHMKKQEYVSTGRRVPPELLQNPPGSLQSIEHLCFQSAKIHFHRRNDVEMKGALSKLPFETQIDFLKKHGKVDLVAELYEKEGQLLNAAKYLRDIGQLKKAIRYAQGQANEDKQFRADCLLTYCKTTMDLHNGPVKFEKYKAESSEREELIGYLTEAVHLFSTSKDIMGLGDAYLLLYLVKLDEKLLKPTFECFGQCNNVVGQLEFLVAVEQTKGLHSGNISMCYPVFKQLITLLVVLGKDENSDYRTQAEKAMIVTCEGFLGISQGQRRSKRKIKRNQGSRGEVFLKHLITQEMSKLGESYKDEIDFLPCRKEMKSYLLEMFKSLVKTFRRILSAEIEKLTLCPQFKIGKDCEDLNKCKGIKRHYQREDLQHLVDRTVKLLTLDAIIHEATTMKYHEQNDSRIGIVSQLKKIIAKPFASCEALYEILFPSGGHSVMLSSSPIAGVQVLAAIKFEMVTSHLQRWAEHIWSTEENRLSSADAFLKVSNIHRLIGLSNKKMDDMLCKAADEYKRSVMKKAHPEKIPKTVGIICEEKEAREIRHMLQKMKGKIPQAERYMFLSVMCRYHNYVQWLHFTSNPVSAMLQMSKFINTLSRKATLPLIPSIANAILCLELETTLLFTIRCAFDAHVCKTRTSVLLPSSFLSQMNWQDTLAKSQKSGKSTCEAVLQAIRSPNVINKGRIETAMKEFCHSIKILCGVTEFDILQDAFDPEYHVYIPSGEAERCLVLALVLLSNVNLVVPIEQEVNLMCALKQIKPHLGLPKRLRNAIKAVHDADGIKDVVFALHNLLWEKNEKLLLCNWEPTDGIYAMKGSPAKPASFPSTFYNPGLDYEMVNENGYDMDEEEPEEYDGGMSHTEQQVAQENSERVEQENRAAKIILKQLLKFRLIAKLYKIHLIRNKVEEKKVQDQQLQELETYGVDDSMCSICGIQFVQPLNPNLPEAVGLAARSYMLPVPVGQTWVTEEETKVQVLETSHTNTAEGAPNMNGMTKKSHIATFEHIQAALSYKIYTKVFNERIIPASTRFTNLKIMVGKVNNPKMVRLKELDVGTLETKYGALMDLFGQTTNARQWTRVKELEDGVGVIESELSRIGKIYQEVLQEMHNQKQASQTPAHVMFDERDERSLPPSVHAQDLEEELSHAPYVEDEAGHLLQVTEKFNKPKGRGRGRGNRK
ncbi:unnamed protein product [Owenia fusiformis]|uniref:UvrD-like helicase ATP-binding domain-containing protein n=1 Tax=Owenia fusiformis TaxID=6347 RepID=A0A8S4QB99_OWEFU|nr:unnamed protein product [Owenia fusiformis]